MRAYQHVVYIMGTVVIKIGTTRTGAPEYMACEMAQMSKVSYQEVHQDHFLDVFSSYEALDQD